MAATGTPTDNARPGDAQGADDLTGRNLRTILDQEQAKKSALTPGERLAGHIAAFCGSLLFVWIHLACFGAWVIFNSAPWFASHPDPFPFPALTIAVSLEAIFLSAFILISQNHETRLAQQRSHLDLQINLLTEQENTQMLKMLRAIATKVGASFDEDPDLVAMEQSTSPERMLEQIDQAIERAQAPPPK